MVFFCFFVLFRSKDYQMTVTWHILLNVIIDYYLDSNTLRVGAGHRLFYRRLPDSTFSFAFFSFVLKKFFYSYIFVLFRSNVFETTVTWKIFLMRLSIIIWIRIRESRRHTPSTPPEASRLNFFFLTFSFLSFLFLLFYSISI